MLAATLVVILAQVAGPGILHVSASIPDPIGETRSIQYEGALASMGPSEWLVGNVLFLVDANTVINQKRARAEVGAWLVVWAECQASNTCRAEYIYVDAAPGRYQFTGTLDKIVGRFWSVSGDVVEIPVGVIEPGNPPMESLLSITARLVNDMLRAEKVEVLAEAPNQVPVEFEGNIQAVEEGKMLVDGRWVLLDGALIEGAPEAGMDAEVEASQGAQDLLYGRRIRVVDPASETRAQGLITGIRPGQDGSQTWELMIFPEEAGQQPFSGSVGVDPDAFVDQSRATIAVGLWVEIQGTKLNDTQYQGEVIRLEMPTPIVLDGDLAPLDRLSDGWWEMAGQPIWWSEPEAAGTASTLAGKTARITGLRLGNGVIWAGRVEGVK